MEYILHTWIANIQCPLSTQQEKIPRSQWQIEQPSIQHLRHKYQLQLSMHPSTTEDSTTEVSSSVVFAYSTKTTLQHFTDAQWEVYVQGNATLPADFLERWSANPVQYMSHICEKYTVIAFDKIKRRYLIARDAFGVQKMFWYKQGNQILLSSDISVLVHTQEKKELATENISEYLSFRYVHAPRTLYKGVYAIPAGQYLIVDAKGEHYRRWNRVDWYSLGTSYPTEKEAKLEVDYLIRRAIETPILAGEKMGVLLSGGLDSTTILYHASQLVKNIDSFTVVLDDEKADESPFAARVAQLCGSKNHLLRVDTAKFISELRSLTKEHGQPLPTAAGAIQQLLIQYSKNYVGSLFSGDGGDEVFGGRSLPQIMSRMKQAELIDKLPNIPKKLAQRIAVSLQKPDWAASYTQFGQERNIGGSKVFIAPERLNLLQDPAMIRPNIRSSILTPFYQEIDSDPINDILYVWQKGWLVEDSLTRISTISQQTEMNLYLPMLDPRLVEYVAKLPGQYKVKMHNLEYVSKWILRQTMEGRIPKRLLQRPKRTILAPLDTWLRKQGKSFLAQQITEMTQKERHIFVPSYLHTLYREHTTGERNHGLQLWTLLLFHLWYTENF